MRPMYVAHLRDRLAIQTHHNAAKGLIAMLDVEVDLAALVSNAGSSQVPRSITLLVILGPRG